MKPKDFVTKLLPFAQECENETGINRFVILAQAALESGWGEHAPGNMYFGVKDVDGINGNEQLINTSEYSTRVNCTPEQVGLVNIHKIIPVTVNGKPYFKYTGQAYFRKFDTPKDSFVQHAELFKKPVYDSAMAHKDNPIEFIKEMAKKYATAPNYAELVTKLYNQIKALAD